MGNIRPNNTYTLPNGNKISGKDLAKGINDSLSDLSNIGREEIIKELGYDGLIGMEFKPSTTEAEAFEKVKAIVVEQLGVDEGDVNIDSTFIDDLGADSLDIVELIMAFEEEFNVEIPDDVAENIKTVKDAVGYIDSAK